MIKNTTLCLLMLFVSLLAYSQTDECGTTLTQEQVDYMNATRLARDAIDVDNVNQVNIPLVAHIIRRSNGTGGLSLADLNLSMSQLNAAFAQLGMQYELCTVNYIDDDFYHDNSFGISYSPGSLEYNLTIPNRVDDKVNVFFVPNNSYCGWSSFPAFKADFDKDWTIMNNQCATNGSTLAHELGHYFNLYHTNQGYSSYLNIFENELVDRSNCGPNVGDELCDTPADPRLSNCVTSSCQYICSYVDTNGDFFTPDTYNIMSFSQKLCRTVFSPQQRSRMLQSYLYDRSNLATSCSNCLTDLNLSGTISNLQQYVASNNIASTQVISPSANVTYQAGQQIRLLPNFNAQAGCDFHAYIQACNNVRMAQVATTYSQDNQEDEVKLLTQMPTEELGENSLYCYPNPFSNSTTIEFTLVQDAPVTLIITDLAGRKVAQLVNEHKLKGKHNLRFDAQALSAGMYLARLQVNEVVKTTKLIVLGTQ